MCLSIVHLAVIEQDFDVRALAVMNGDLDQLTSFPAFEPSKGKGEMKGSESDLDHSLRLALSALEKKNDSAPVESASRPPSPPESGVTTPRLRLSPCPPRLWSFVPPPNYGVVDKNMFRSSYPQDRNIDFVRSLRIRSILTLVTTEPTPGYQEWVEGSKIRRLQIDIATNKEGKVNTTLNSLCEALLFIMDSSNYPLYIHCNQGKHRTGCVVACLRKIQHWPMEKILEEYRIYAGKKARDGDIELIKSFEPENVFEYARRHGYMSGAQPRMRRLDSTISDIDSLAAALAAGAMNDEADSPDWDLSTISSTSSETSESALELRIAGTASATQTPNTKLETEELF